MNLVTQPSCTQRSDKGKLNPKKLRACSGTQSMLLTIFSQLTNERKGKEKTSNGHNTVLVPGGQSGITL